jgi:predicted alpha/beta superfamily hydrolase
MSFRHALSALLCSALLACGGAAPLDSASDGIHGAAAKASTVVVHYPTGWGHRVSLRGTGPLSWGRGQDATWTANDEWKLTLQLTAAIELKPLFDDATWAIGPNWTLQPGQTLDVWPHFFRGAGQLDTVDGWTSNRLGNSRSIRVYLPPAYLENSGQRFPVVYMHDGQNLFDDSLSFGGVSWNIAGAMDQGARDASIHEAIIVGVDNTADRMSEYTPVVDADYGGGNADAYLDFLVNELKPWVDARYRTLPGRADTAIMGSSLGGLVSAYAGLKRPDVFGLVGAVSPSTWWANDYILGAVQQSKGAALQPLRVYVDSGDAGPSNDDVTNTAKLAQAYKDLGLPVQYVVQHGGQHNESYWRQRAPGALGFLLGGR